MNRRRFLNMFSNLLKASLAASVLPPWARASLTEVEVSLPLHYTPLNGRRLREIARRKEHHGNGRFLNPLGVDRSGRLLKVLSWKLFHRNPIRGGSGRPARAAAVRRLGPDSSAQTASPSPISNMPA